MHVRLRLLSVLALATVTLLPTSGVLAYRSARDLPELAGGSGAYVRWASPTVAYAIRPSDSYAFAASTALGVLQSKLAAIECSAAQVGFYSSPNELPVASRSGDGINGIYFITSGWEAASGSSDSQGAVTELDFAVASDGTATIVEADILIDASKYSFFVEPSSALSSQDRSLPAVLFHEILHGFGFLHPCELTGGSGVPSCSSDATFVARMMYPTYVGPSQAELSGDEVAGLCDMYPASSCATECDGGSVCVAGQCVALCGTTTCSVGAICLDGECRAKCGEIACAEGDACVDGACHAVCAATGVVCPGGTLCSDSFACHPSCLGWACDDVRSCDASTPCPSGLSCDQGRCRSDEGIVGDACTSDRGCDPAFRCIESVCFSGVAHQGDPCSDARECASGICLGARCRIDCENGCDSAHYCSDESDPPTCATATNAAEFGESCRSGQSCASRICLLSNEAAPRCTRACTRAFDDCPDHFECADVDGRDLCVPELDSGIGCSVSTTLAGGDGGLFVILIVTAALVSRRRISRSTKEAR